MRPTPTLPPSGMPAFALLTKRLPLHPQPTFARIPLPYVCVAASEAPHDSLGLSEAETPSLLKGDKTLCALGAEHVGSRSCEGSCLDDISGGSEPETGKRSAAELEASGVGGKEWERSDRPRRA